MRIQGNKILSNRGLFVDPVEYFNTINSSALSEDIFLYLGEVIGYPKESEISTPGAILFTVPGIQSFSSVSEIEALAYVALPANPNSYTKPVPGQIIYIVEMQDNYTYLGSFQSGINENGTFLLELVNPNTFGLNTKSNVTEYKNIESGTSSPNSKNKVSNYDTLGFKIKDTVIPAIKEKSGESHLKGMVNNNIVLSYNDKGDPNIILVINRKDKNYNQNSDGIFIFGNDDVDKGMNIPSEIKDNFPTDEKTGSVIVLNSNKFRINSKNGSVYISSAKNISLSSNNDFTVDAKKKTNINSSEIILGNGATELIVLGNKLKSLLSSLIDEIMKLTVGTANGPSSPPINISSFAKIKTQLEGILSKQNKTL
jgi:hypothetical protein